MLRVVGFCARTKQTLSVPALVKACTLEYESHNLRISGLLNFSSLPELEPQTLNPKLKGLGIRACALDVLPQNHNPWLCLRL